MVRAATTAKRPSFLRRGFAIVFLPRQGEDSAEISGARFFADGQFRALGIVSHAAVVVRPRPAPPRRFDRVETAVEVRQLDPTPVGDRNGARVRATGHRSSMPTDTASRIVAGAAAPPDGGTVADGVSEQPARVPRQSLGRQRHAFYFATIAEPELHRPCRTWRRVNRKKFAVDSIHFCHIRNVRQHNMYAYHALKR
jgi:hypothetical protein